MSISVVIPAYNAEHFLAQTLESVLAQTLAADEILVVDDGSTDATASIAEGFGPQVTVFRRPNSKAAAARNFGVEQATSDWVAFLDADDIWLPDKLQRQMQELRSDPGADLCYTSMTTLVHDGDHMRVGDLMMAPPPEEIRHWLSRRCAILPSSVVVRRSTLQKAGGFDCSLRHGCEDYDLWFRLCNMGTRFCACNESLVYYRMHGNNTALSLDWFHEYTGVYRRQNLPHLSVFDRWITWNRLYSQSAYGTSLYLYRKHDSRCMRLIALSIFRFPLSRGGKYTALAKMFRDWVLGSLHNRGMNTALPSRHGR